MRTPFLDYDARSDPKTDRFCVKCQRDIKPGQPARKVFMVPGGDPFIVHPEDVTTEATETFLLGLDCAKEVGLDWSIPETQ